MAWLPTDDTIFFLLSSFSAAVIALALVSSAAMLLALRRFSRDRENTQRSLDDIGTRLEALTGQLSDRYLNTTDTNYSSVLDSLVERLPNVVAQETGNQIFETESKILTRLAEIDPMLRNDVEAQRKMDEIIRSMENLEKNIIGLTAAAVKTVMIEKRDELLRQ
jgi:hypothetical protein